MKLCASESSRRPSQSRREYGILLQLLKGDRMDGPAMTARIFKCPTCFKKLSYVKGEPCHRCASEAGKARITPAMIDPAPAGARGGKLAIDRADRCHGCGLQWNQWELSTLVDGKVVARDFRTYIRGYLAEITRYTLRHPEGDVVYKHIGDFYDAVEQGYGLAIHGPVREGETLGPGTGCWDINPPCPLIASMRLCGPCWQELDYLLLPPVDVDDAREIETLHNPSLTGKQIRDGVGTLVDPLLPSELESDLRREIRNYEASITEECPAGRIPRPSLREGGTRDTR